MEQAVLKEERSSLTMWEKLNIFGDNAARTKARLEAWYRKKKMETEL
jgi:hypothetical protein